MYWLGKYTYKNDLEFNWNTFFQLLKFNAEEQVLANENTKNGFKFSISVVNLEKLALDLQYGNNALQIKNAHELNVAVSLFSKTNLICRTTKLKSIINKVANDGSLFEEFKKYIYFYCDSPNQYVSFAYGENPLNFKCIKTNEYSHFISRNKFLCPNELEQAFIYSNKKDYGNITVTLTNKKAEGIYILNTKEAELFFNILCVSKYQVAKRFYYVTDKSVQQLLSYISLILYKWINATDEEIKELNYNEKVFSKLCNLAKYNLNYFDYLDKRDIENIENIIEHNYSSNFYTNPTSLDENNFLYNIYREIIEESKISYEKKTKEKKYCKAFEELLGFNLELSRYWGSNNNDIKHCRRSIEDSVEDNIYCILNNEEAIIKIGEDKEDKEENLIDNDTTYDTDFDIPLKEIVADIYNKTYEGEIVSFKWPEDKDIIFPDEVDSYISESNTTIIENEKGEKNMDTNSATINSTIINSDKITTGSFPALNIFGESIEFGIVNNSNIASTLLGVAVKSENGSWRILDKDKKVLTDIGALQIGNFPVMVMPSTKLSVGDLIKEGNNFYYIVSKENNVTKVLNVSNGEYKEIAPIHNIMGISFHSKLVTFESKFKNFLDTNGEKSNLGAILMMGLAMNGFNVNDNNTSNNPLFVTPSNNDGFNMNNLISLLMPIIMFKNMGKNDFSLDSLSDLFSMNTKNDEIILSYPNNNESETVKNSSVKSNSSMMKFMMTIFGLSMLSGMGASGTRNNNSNNNMNNMLQLALLLMLLFGMDDMF